MNVFLHQVEATLRSITNQNNQIQKFVSFCIQKCVLQEFQLSKLFQKYFIQGDCQMKTNIIIILGQILIISHEKQLKSFTKVFAQKFKFFIDEIQYLQITSGMAYSILIQIQKCEQNKIFAASFFQKIKGSSAKIAEKLDLVSLDGKYQLNYQKYSKTFLMKMQDIMAYKDLECIYNTYCLHFELQSQTKNSSQLLLNDPNCEVLTNNNQCEKPQSKHQSTVPQAQNHQNKINIIQNVIMQCHTHIFNLQQKLKEELKEFINESQQSQKAQFMAKMNEKHQNLSNKYSNSANDKSMDSLIYPFDD